MHLFLAFDAIFGALSFLVTGFFCVGAGGVVIGDAITGTGERIQRSAYYTNPTAYTNSNGKFEESALFQSGLRNLSVGFLSIDGTAWEVRFAFPAILSNLECGLSAKWVSVGSVSAIEPEAGLRWYPFHDVPKGVYVGSALTAGYRLTGTGAPSIYWGPKFSAGYRVDAFPIQITFGVESMPSGFYPATTLFRMEAGWAW